MANRTDKEAYAIHGTNPQNLVEYIIRQKIYQTTYWKEKCFALTAESLVERAAELRAAGGTFGGGRKPTPFLCLILKMLQIQPAKEIIIEYIKNGDFKYIRLLGAFYMRLVGRPLEVYQYLEPLYNDYRKVRIMTLEGQYVLRHMDEVVDDMLYKDHLFDIAMPRLPARLALEKLGTLEPRVSVLDDEFDETVIQAEAEEAAEAVQRAKEELADVREGEGGRHTHHHREDRGGEDTGGDERRREHSPERRKEKWQLTSKERKEQASRRRSSASRSRSPSHSPSRRSPDRDRRDRSDRDKDRSDRDRDRSDRDRDRSDRRRDDYDSSRDERRREGDRDRDRRDDYDRRDHRDYDRDRRRDDRDRDRARERRRSRSRSRSRDRGGRDRDRRSRSPDRRERDKGDRGDRAEKSDKGEGRKSEKSEKASGHKSDGSGKRDVDPTDPEIIEANKQRAALGLKPLR